MNNERFAVPEILLHPSDVGIQEMGIPEAIHHSISCLPSGLNLSSVCYSSTHEYECDVVGFFAELQPHMYLNIVLTGGNFKLPGLKDRVYVKNIRLNPEQKSCFKRVFCFNLRSFSEYLAVHESVMCPLTSIIKYIFERFLYIFS